ncbi:MAG: CotH kinase family protein [Crocinitomicaceae bacterium]
MKKIIIVLVLLLCTVFGLSIFKFGIKDSIKINAMAMLCAVENRVPNNDIPTGIPVYHITITHENWEALTADLPASGRKKQKILFEHNGETYKAKLRTRGHLKLHWGGPKKSLRVYFDKDDSPFGTISEMNFLNPKTFQFTNDHIGTWVGKITGAKTLKNEMVFLRINGQNYGLMEMIEQPGRSYAINNNLGNEKITLYKGDYIRDDSGHSKSVRVWKNAEYWNGKKASKAASSKLTSLIQVLNSDTLQLEDRFSLIEKHVIIEEYLKYYAALTVINTEHIDQTHNQVIVFDRNQKKYYPVLWDPTFMWAHSPERYYNFYDPLSYYILQNPIWREKRDIYIHKFIVDWYDSGKFMAYHKTLEDSLYKAVKLDHNKCNPIGADLNTVYRFSNIIYGHSNNKIRAMADDYYTALKVKMDKVNIDQVVISDSSINMTYNTYSPIELKIHCETPISDSSISLTRSVGQLVETDGELITIKLFGQIEHEDGPEGDLYKLFSGFVSQQKTVNIDFKTKINKVEAYNAITGRVLKFQ